MSAKNKKRDLKTYVGFGATPEECEENLVELPSGWDYVPQRDSSEIVLNPDDPFDAALIPIVRTNRAKRRDYSHDGKDVFTNFRETAEAMAIDGFDAISSADFNICQKQARLKALRVNGRLDEPNNESVLDTYLDRAVYSVIAYALKLEQAKA